MVWTLPESVFSGRRRVLLRRWADSYPVWAALTVLDAVREYHGEYRGPGVLPGALCPTLYVMNPLSGTLVAPETPRDEDIPSQGQDTRLVTESDVGGPRPPAPSPTTEETRHVDSSVDLYSTCAIHGYGRSKELI